MEELYPEGRPEKKGIPDWPNARRESPRRKRFFAQIQKGRRQG
jgi:hypothetical protein